MAIPYWVTRTLGETRGRLLELVRHQPLTVEELALAVARTRNAVRTHLSALERDGFVERSPSRRAVRGQPAQLYRIAERGEALLSTAYPRTTAAILDAMEQQLSAAQVTELLRSAGRRLAAQRAGSMPALRARVAAAIAALDELGAVAHLRSEAGEFELHSPCCPLGALTDSHPVVCQALASFVSEIVGVPVTDRCERSSGLARPRCRLAIEADQTIPDASGYPGE